MSLTAAEDILVTSEQGSVKMEAGAGLVLDTVNWNHIFFVSYLFATVAFLKGKEIGANILGVTSHCVKEFKWLFLGKIFNHLFKT